MGLLDPKRVGVILSPSVATSAHHFAMQRVPHAAQNVAPTPPAGRAMLAKSPDVVALAQAPQLALDALLALAVSGLSRSA